MATNILEMSGIWYNAAKNMEFYQKVGTKFNISVNILKLIDKTLAFRIWKLINWFEYREPFFGLPKVPTKTVKKNQ